MGKGKAIVHHMLNGKVSPANEVFTKFVLYLFYILLSFKIYL